MEYFPYQLVSRISEPSTVLHSLLCFGGMLFGAPFFDIPEACMTRHVKGVFSPQPMDRSSPPVSTAFSGLSVDKQGKGEIPQNHHTFALFDLVI